MKIIDTIIKPGFWSTGEPRYNDIGLYDTSSLASDIPCYQFLTVNRNIILLGYNDIRLQRHRIFGPFRDVVAEFDSMFYLLIWR